MQKHTTQTPFDVSKLTQLPEVGIVYNYANASDIPAKAFIANGYQGIVSAGVGNGEINDDKYGCVASGTLSPYKSRVLLMLALTQTKDPNKIQQYFM